MRKNSEGNEFVNLLVEFVLMQLLICTRIKGVNGLAKYQRFKIKVQSSY